MFMSDVGHIPVSVVLTKVAAMKRAQWYPPPPGGSKGSPLLSTNLTAKHFLIKESSSTELITELKIIVRSMCD
jgi:hypothetical protein